MCCIKNLPNRRKNTKQMEIAFVGSKKDLLRENTMQHSRNQILK